MRCFANQLRESSLGGVMCAVLRIVAAILLWAEVIPKSARFILCCFMLFLRFVILVSDICVSVGTCSDATLGVDRRYLGPSNVFTLVWALQHKARNCFMACLLRFAV